jgi:hypothetical protein
MITHFVKSYDTTTAGAEKLTLLTKMTKGEIVTRLGYKLNEINP